MIKRFGRIAYRSMIPVLIETCPMKRATGSGNCGSCSQVEVINNKKDSTDFAVDQKPIQFERIPL